jgi:IS4 transposase
MQQKKQLPLLVRLIRIRAEKKRDVWLLTNVMEAKKLPAALAGRYYRWRWENEGLFRTFKRTLAKVRLMGRTVRDVHREAEGALGDKVTR